MENLEVFLKELSDLSIKYNLYIGGCGCCGYPFIYVNFKNYRDVADNLNFNFENNKYEVEK